MFISVLQWETSTSVWIQESFVPPQPSLDPSIDNSLTARIAVITKDYKPETSESNLCDSRVVCWHYRDNLPLDM